MKKETEERIDEKKVQLWEKLGQVNLLIVDDDSFSRTLVESLLGKIPQFNFFEARDGLEALDVIKNSCIDVILLDLHMPNMNGFELIEALKEDVNYKHIPILVMSIYDEERDELCNGKVDGFIYKPFKLEELRSKVYKVLISKPSQDRCLA